MPPSVAGTRSAARSNRCTPIGQSVGGAFVAKHKRTRKTDHMEVGSFQRFSDVGLYLHRSVTTQAERTFLSNSVVGCTKNQLNDVVVVDAAGVCEL